MQSELQTDILAQLQNVHKRFGATEALKGIDLEVRQGEIVALLGPNGAGKTTAISILLGRRRPDQGQALLFDRDPRLPKARMGVGATPQETEFPNTLTVKNVVELVQTHFPNPRPTEELLGQLGILDLMGRQTGGLSGGQQRRLAVVLAFVGNPKVVFLDEPTTGLDVEARRGLWQAIEDYRVKGGTVLLTTHYLEEAEALASRVVVIDQGKVIAQGTVEEIKSRVGLKQVRFRADVLPQLPGVVKTEQENGVHILYTPDADELVRNLVGGAFAFEGLEVLPASLEEAFLVLTGGVS